MSVPSPLKLAVILGVILWVVRWTILAETEKAHDAIKEATGTVVLDNIQSVIDMVKDDDTDLVSHATDSMGRMVDLISDSNAENSSPSGLARPSGSSLIGEMFRVGQQVTRELDDIVQGAVPLSSADENELGKGLHQSIVEAGDVIRNEELSRLLARLSQPFLAMRSRTALSIQFTVLDSGDVNAFAHIGGFVYVNRGLIELLDDEAELAFALGHEIAHIELGHCSRQAKIITLAKELGGDGVAPLAQAAYSAVAAGYSEDMELEADAWAYRAMPTGRSSALKFLERLSRLELQSSTAPSSDVLGAVLLQLDEHFASHPKTRRRIDALLALEDR